jgi:hypothetical protein
MSNFNTRKYDYALYYPIIGAEARGTVSKLWIHKKYWYGPVITKYYEPYQPETERQVFWQEYHAKAVHEWQSFTDEQKEIYNKMRYPPKNTGYGRFLSKYLKASSKYLDNL